LKVVKKKILDYKGFLQQVAYANDEADELIVNDVLKQFSYSPNIVSGTNSPVFAIDYTKRKYLFCGGIGKQFAGCRIEDVLDGGLEVTTQKAHPEFHKIFCTKVFPNILNIYANDHKKPEQNSYTFSFNFRMKDTFGKWLDILQCGTYILSEETGLPLYFVGTWTDITLFKTDNAIVHKIEKLDLKTGLNQIIDVNYFYPFADEASLSRKEIEIIKYIADGLSGKMMALKLNISYNTINQHRQNILRKTNCKNMAQLIMFAVNNGIL